MAIIFNTNIGRKYRRFSESNFKIRAKLLRHAVVQYTALALVSLPWLLIFIILWAIRPLVKVQIGLLFHERIGHLSVNTELFLRRRIKRDTKVKIIDILLTSTPTNRQLLRMIKRRVFVLESRIWPTIFWVMRKWTNGSEILIDLPQTLNEYEEFNNIPPQLTFTSEEEAKGQALLQSMGINPDSPFICFYARDNVYLQTVHTYRSSAEWAYLDYRDNNILNCLPSAEYMAAQNIYSLRLGQVVKEALPSTSSRIIDYAADHRTDFGDIYLVAKCKFFLGSSGGILAVSYIFNTPVAHTNVIPLRHIPFEEHDLFIPKKLWNIKEERWFTFSEIIDSGMDIWTNAEWFKDAGVQVIENTAEEILDLAKEMQARLDGDWVATEENEHLQRRFKSLFPPSHHCHGFPSRIGADFLRKNIGLLE